MILGQSAIVTIPLSCAISEIQRLISQKSRTFQRFHTRPVFTAAVTGDPVRISYRDQASEN